MLESDLTRLAEIGPDVSLAALEPGVWSRVEAAHRLARVGRVTARLQLAVVAATLLVSVTVGVELGRPARLPAGIMQLSSVAAELAPSSLIGPRP